MENTSKDTLIDSPFSEQVEFNLQMLQYRLDELKAIDTTKAENHQKYLMVFDSFIVLFRALLLEKGQSQYTIQHYFKELRNNSIDEKVNRFLDQPFYDGVYEDLSIRKCLKFIADKFVCHIDPVSSMDVGMANSMMSWLSNPFFYNNIINISTKLFEIINEDGKSYIMQSNTIESKQDVTWICSVCGYQHVGPTPPKKCPQCGVDDIYSDKAGQDLSAAHVLCYMSQTKNLDEISGI